MDRITASEKDEKVRAVLNAATKPMSPSEIGMRIAEPWCTGAFTKRFSYPSAAAISPSLKRIGAEKVRRGQWQKPSNGWAGEQP